MRLRVAVLVAALAAVAPSPAIATSLPPVKHVFVIVLENRGFDGTFGFNSPAHYLSWTLPQLGALVPNYYGVTHQSLGNYVALVSGQGSNPATQADCQIYTNVLPGTIGSGGQASGAGCVYPKAVKTVADQLTAVHLSWKGYMEDMGNASGQPQTCRHPALPSHDGTQSARHGDQYAARHNPFAYFHSLLDSGQCAQNDLPLDRLPIDLRSSATTPNYSFITPNLCNDGHDAPCVDGRPGGLVSADAFLRAWVPRILASPAYRSGGLLAIIFDESDGTDASACCGEPQFPFTPNNGGEYPGRGGGHTGAVMISPYIDPGTIDLTAYNHFSLLASVENLFGLGHLGYAATPGLQTLGSSLFTCYAPGHPRVRQGRLPSGSLVKLAWIGQGAARRPLVELKLWHAGQVTVRVARSGHPRTRTIASRRRVIACQPFDVRLPYRHGKVTVTARAFGGLELRTLTF